jgi:hypothetical protein
MWVILKGVDRYSPQRRARKDATATASRVNASSVGGALSQENEARGYEDMMGVLAGQEKGSRRASWLGNAVKRLVSLAVGVALVVSSGTRSEAKSSGGSPNEAAPSEVTLDEVIDEERKGDEAAAESQSAIDVLSDDIDGLAAEYRRTMHDTRALRIYNKQVKELIASQEEEMASLQKQIAEVTVVGRQVVPLMLRMIDTLEKFIGMDVPFLSDERSKRIADLRSMMDRADVTISEKYRRILEAYQIENEYGRTIEAYRAPLDANGAARTVDFLRIGRVALMYQTLDAQESGMWEASQERWVKLSGEYRNAIRQGLRMARKQVAPDLIRVPVPAPVEVTR